MNLQQVDNGFPSFSSSNYNEFCLITLTYVLAHNSHYALIYARTQYAFF
jgi:hypothetical protein